MAEIWSDNLFKFERNGFGKWKLYCHRWELVNCNKLTQKCIVSKRYLHYCFKYLVMLWSICVCSLKFSYLNTNPKSGGINKWGLGWLHYRYTAFMNGISFLIKEPWEISLAPSILWRHKKKAVVYEARSRLSQSMKSASDSISDFLASRTLRNKFLPFIIHWVYGVLL